jgi:hypothetical protein
VSFSSDRASHQEAFDVGWLSGRVGRLRGISAAEAEALGKGSDFVIAEEADDMVRARSL